MCFVGDDVWAGMDQRRHAAHDAPCPKHRGTARTKASTGAGRPASGSTRGAAACGEAKIRPAAAAFRTEKALILGRV